MDQGPATTDESFHELADQVEVVWTNPATSSRLKKRIVRTLIEEILVGVDTTRGELILMT
jgi:hypothetical protein